MRSEGQVLPEHLLRAPLTLREGLLPAARNGFLIPWARTARLGRYWASLCLALRLSLRADLTALPVV